MDTKSQSPTAANNPHLGTWVMGSPVPPQAHPANQKAAATSVPIDQTPGVSVPDYYPRDVNYSGVSSYNHNPNPNPNPYVQIAPAYPPKDKGSMDSVLKVLSKCGKKVEGSTKKATGTAESIWHHLKTGPSVYDAAMARVAQGTKVLVEGGSDKIFQQIFGSLPGEKLKKTFACYISTSSGPVIGTMYVSTKRVAFCSDNPLCHYSAVGQQEWVYYKIVVQVDQLREVNPSVNVKNPAEKYIQLLTVDNHEFWFMGFVSFEKALKALTGALHRSHA